MLLQIMILLLLLLLLLLLTMIIILIILMIISNRRTPGWARWAPSSGPRRAPDPENRLIIKRLVTNNRSF